MKKPEAKRLTNKIVAIILEEINGYSKKEAQEYASENEGHEVYDRIESLLIRQPTQHNKDLITEEDLIIVAKSAMKYGKNWGEAPENAGYEEGVFFAMNDIYNAIASKLKR